MDNYIVKNGKKLKCGYTTGTCATAASVASTIMLISQKEIQGVSVILPKGDAVNFFIEDIKIEPDFASCYVVKNAGDDPDVTDGAKIFSTVKFCDTGINIHGGKGVGKVTSKGLQCAVGESAINPVPRRMITGNVTRILKRFNCQKGLDIEISVENGEEIAKKTYNGRLGIVGGISILGTTGIVEPMSEKALIDTIKIMIDKQKLINPDNILISPGNYGEDFCRNHLGITLNDTVKISNYIGEALDYIKYKEFKNLLLVGHIGKLVKIASGVMNTHSSVADCRLETLAAHCGMAGASKALINDVMNCVTTDEALDLIKASEVYEIVTKSILDKIMFHIDYRLRGEMNFGIVLFNTDGSHVIKSSNSEELINLFKEKKDER